MSDDESDALTPRFDLAAGEGTPLGELPCFTTAKTRGAAAKAFEAALEPLHRLVYGRAGVSGRRRAALEPFKGFPRAMADEVKTKLRGLLKSKLKDLVMTLGMGLHVSQPLEPLADGAAAFLMAPKDAGKIKSAKGSPAKKRSTSAHMPEPVSQPSSSAAPATPPTKRAKVEVAAAASAKPSAKASAARPSEAEVQVQIYQRVLSMTPETRDTLGVKALRMELEKHFKLAEGALKDKKELIATTASDCVRALLEAERRALLVMQTPSTASGPAQPDMPPEPTPSPVPAAEHVQEASVPPSLPVVAPKPTVFEHQPL